MNHSTMPIVAALALALPGAALAQATPEPAPERPGIAPAPEQVAADAPAEGAANPSQLLLIGNSYLYYGDSLHNHLNRMAEHAYPDTEFDYKSATISGAYLDQHPIDSLLTPGQLGLDEPFDVVILQGHSGAGTTPERQAGFREAAVEFDGKIDATGAQTALYMTHAYNEAHDSYDPEMIRQIEELYTSVGEETGAIVIPVGLAFEEAYKRRPDIELHKSFDGSHPTLLGTYLAAATTFATLYDESAVGNPETYFGEISEEDAAFLQQVAEDTVAAFEAR